MASTFIPGLVIKHNNDVFMNTDLLTAGIVMPIPTPGAGGVPDGNYWAQPINDNVVSGFNYIPITSANSATPPTAQSFKVFRLVTKYGGLGGDSWYVRGSTTSARTGSPLLGGYIEAAADAECCSATPAGLPVDVPVFSPCQTMCDWDVNSKYFASYGMPTLPAGKAYYPYGYFNGTLLTAASGAGYANPTLLLAFLNSGAWGAIGTWAYSDVAKTQLTVTQAAGAGTDTICVSIVTV